MLLLIVEIAVSSNSGSYETVVEKFQKRITRIRSKDKDA